MSMALRNQLLGQKACLVESTFLPGKPRDTRAQRLAIRRSVMLWGARASYETTSTSADSFTSGSSVLDNLENVASKLWENNGNSGKEKRTLEFVKYEGLGNDFIMVNNLDSDTPIITPEEASCLCDRHLGIGGDGVIFVMKDKDRYNGIDDDYYQMRIYNSDGSEPEMCGNGIRCVGKYLAEIKKAKAPKRYNVLTLGGNMILDLREDGQVCVDMGPPILNAPDVPTKLKAEGEVVKAPLEVDGKTWSVTCVSMGNPHCVTFGEHGGEELNVDSLPLEQIGPLFEHHEMFPVRTNTEFVECISRTHLKMRVWERGAGATQACGTGACAVVVAAVKEGHSERNCVVDLPGGPLEIEWRKADNHIYMTGPAKRVFHGLIPLEG